MNIDLVKSFQFEAAHRSKRPGADEPVLHGHSYRAEILVSGPCDPHYGWVMDYGDITRQFDPLYRMLDHQFLDELEGLNDTSLAGVRAWIRERFHLDGAFRSDVRVSIVGRCAYLPEQVAADSAYGLPPRLRFGFEAAHSLPNVPETHKCRRMHGHSFTVEVGAKDIMRLGERLADVYHALDHTCLNELEGLANPTSENVARWIWSHLAQVTPDLSVVVVAETCTARCMYRGT